MDGLTLLALVGIVDPPRPAAKAAIATAHAAGIQVRMITGDHAITAEAIARELGIEGRAITGAQFAELSDEQADAEIDDIGVIARVTPEQKVRLVDILKRKGHVVGMTGDGVNDAPALKQADIGIAMGITGTEVSKEAAAMILTDDNFATIVKAVELGRGLYDNLVKYIRFQMGVLAGHDRHVPRREHPQHRQRRSRSCRCRRCGSTSPRRSSSRSGSATAQPSEGLMERRPRKPEQPILNRGRHALVRRRRARHGGRHARGRRRRRARRRRASSRARWRMTTFAIANLVFSFTARDELRSVFSLDTFNDRTFLLTSLMSVARDHLRHRAALPPARSSTPSS